MLFTVIINNYNYGHVLQRAATSVLCQKRRCDQLVIVDDGSTDDSLDVARKIEQSDRRVCVIRKANGGQMSALNAGFRVAQGDIICLLDADDEYLPGYLEKLENLYEENRDIDFVYAGIEYRDSLGSSDKRKTRKQSFDHGISIMRTIILADWVGAPTSAISARRSLMSRILPFAYEDWWRIRADDVIIIGAALCMGRKFFLADKCVIYHIHGSNSFYGRAKPRSTIFQESMSRKWLVGYFGAQHINYLSMQSRFSLGRLVVSEFEAMPRKTLKEFRVYLRVIRRSRALFKMWWTIRLGLILFAHMKSKHKQAKAGKSKL